MPANPYSRRRTSEGMVVLLRTRDVALLVTLRERTGLTQRALAAQVEISAQMMSSIERGDRNPSLEVGRRLADFYGVKLDALFEQEAVEFGETA